MLAIGAQLAGDHQPDPRAIEEMIGLRSSKATPAVDVDDAEEEGGEETEPAVTIQGDIQTAASAAEASPIVVSTEPDATVVTNNTTPSIMVADGKASDRIEIVPGIYERVLPDGRVAFLAGKDEAEGVRLKLACEGLARWNPRYRNWLTDMDQATVIREALLATQKEQAEVKHAVR
jgi:hypothetical protein